MTNHSYVKGIGSSNNIFILYHFEIFSINKLNWIIILFGNKLYLSLFSLYNPSNEEVDGFH